MWPLLVIHFFASGALLFDDFTKPSATATFSDVDSSVNPYYCGTFWTQTALAPNRTVFNAYVPLQPDDGDNNAFFSWFLGGKKIFGVQYSELSGTDSTMALTYTLQPSVLNLSAEKVFYVTYEVTRTTTASHIAITVVTSSGVGSCDVATPSNLPINTQTNAVCTASAMGLSAASLASTVSLGVNISIYGDGIVYLHTFGTASPLVLSIVANKTVAAGNAVELDFTFSPSISVGSVLFQFSSPAGSMTNVSVTAASGLTSVNSTLIVSSGTAPGVYPVTVLLTGQSGNLNIITNPTQTFYVTVTQLPITTLSGVPVLQVTPDVTNSSVFTFTTDNQAVNASVRLTPSSPYFIFDPPYVFVVPGTKTSGSLIIHARESAPQGLWGFNVSVTGETYNNNGLSAVTNTLFSNQVNVTLDALTAVTTTSLTLVAGSSGQLATFSANVRPVNGSIQLTPISPWLTFVPSTIHFRGTTTAGIFNVTALAGAPAGPNPIQVTVQADAGNNNLIPQNLLTVSSQVVSVIQPQINTITQLQSLTNLTAGGSAVNVTYVLPIIALNGSISVSLSSSGLNFSSNPLIIPQGNDRATVSVTALSGAVPGLSPVSALMTSLINNNDQIITTAVTVNGLQVVQYLIDSVSLSSNVVVAAGDDVNHQMTSFVVPVPVVNDTITLTPSATKLSFNPSSVTISPGSSQTITFEVIAASDATAGKPNITVSILQGTNNNNRLAHPSFLISNAVTVNLIPITGVVINAESGATQRNHQGNTTFTLTTLKVVNSPITLTPLAAGITFTPSFLTVAVGQFKTGMFSYVASSQAVGGLRNINVTLTGSSNNNDKSLSPFNVSGLTILNAVIGNDISLTPVVSFVAGTQSLSTAFYLDTLASNGAITITPAYPGLTFSPLSVTVPAESTNSPTFTVNVNSTVDLSKSPLPVTLTLVQNGGNNNNLLSSYTINLPVNGLQINTVAYTQGENHLYAGSSIPNQYLTVDNPALKEPVTLTPSSPFFDFVPPSVNISVGSMTSGLFTIFAKPYAVAGANQFSVAFSRPSDNNNVVPNATVTISPVIVEQQLVSNVYVLNPITVQIGEGPSAATRFYVDYPAVNGSIVLTPQHPLLIFTPTNVSVLPGTNVSQPFTVTAPENMGPSSPSVQFFVDFTPGNGNNNLLPGNSPAPSSNNGILVIKPVFVDIHLNETLVAYAGESWSNQVTLKFDVPMLNDSAVFNFTIPGDGSIQFSTSSVTVAHGSTESSPFQVKFADFVNPQNYPFHISNTGGHYLNNNVSQLGSVAVTGLSVAWAAITMGTIPTTTVDAGGNATNSLTITIDVAPVYSDIDLSLSGDNLIFTPNVVKVAKGALVSEPFTVTADDGAIAGSRQFQAAGSTVSGENSPHNTYSTLNVDISVGQLEYHWFEFVAPLTIIAGNPLGTQFQVRADERAINGIIYAFCDNEDISVPSAIEWTTGTYVSTPSYAWIDRSVRPKTELMLIELGGFAPYNMNLTNNIFLVMGNVTVADGYGPVLNVTNVAPAVTFVQLTLTTDEACSVWCKTVLSGAIAPSIPNGYEDHFADVNFTDRGVKTFNLTGLTSNTAYDLYCFGVDVYSHPNTAAEVYNFTLRHFRTTVDPQAENVADQPKVGLAPASVAGIVIGSIIGVLLFILLAVGIKRWLNSRSDWTKNESLFLEAELAQKKKPVGDVVASGPSSPVASPAPPAPALAVSSNSAEGLPSL